MPQVRSDRTPVGEAVKRLDAVSLHYATAPAERLVSDLEHDLADVGATFHEPVC